MLTIPNIQTKPIFGLLGVSGVLNMGSAGNITNENNDFSIKEDGYSVSTQSIFTRPKSYKIVDDEGNVVGAIWGTESEMFVDGGANNVRIQSIGGTVQMGTSHRYVKVVDANRVEIGRSNGNIIINPNLPFGDPGVVGALFRTNLNEITNGQTLNFFPIVGISLGP